jgi:hypothetical protein
MHAVALAAARSVVSRTCVVVVRGREPSLGGAWSSRANSGAFRLVRGAISGQKSQSVRDHKKVRRKEKRETSVQVGQEKPACAHSALD